MKRSEALTPLSHDHHHGLFAAQRLTRATPETAAAARPEFLAFWEDEGRQHFRLEEEVLLPAWARYGDAGHEAVVRMLVEHVELRSRADALAADPAPGPDALHDLGRRLQEHIRHEERVLFPLIEATVPGDELARLAVALEH
jgi:iron-sulfur cluster repair protein YtfE (RIC family)